MARLPQPGGDNGNWGTILNDYLSQALKTDGTIKDNIVGASNIAPNAVTAAKIAADAVGATQIADGSVTNILLADATITESKLSPSVQTKLNNAGTGGVIVDGSITKAKLVTAVQTSLDKADSALQVAPVTSVATKTGAITLTKSDVGLANVDNTSDANKPISTVTQSALDAKSALSHTHTATQISDSTATGRSILTATDATAARTAIGAGTSNLAIGTSSSTAKAGDYAPTKSDVGLANVDNTSDANKPVSSAQQTLINSKLDKNSLVFNVKDYGAVGDNVTDDLVAIQAAITASSAKSTIYFPPGIYRTSGPIIFKGERQYLGAGGGIGGTSVVKLLDNVNITGPSGVTGVFVPEEWSTNSTGGGSPVSFEGLNITANKAANASGQACGIILMNYWSSINSCYIHDTNSDNIRATDVTANGTAITTATGSENRITENHLTAAGGCAFRQIITGSSGSHLDGYFCDNTIQGPLGTGAVVFDVTTGWTIRGNHSYGVNGHGYYLPQAYAVTVESNYLEDFGKKNDAAVTYYGIYTYNYAGRGVTIRGNNIACTEPTANTSTYIYISVNGNATTSTTAVVTSNQMRAEPASAQGIAIRAIAINTSGNWYVSVFGNNAGNVNTAFSQTGTGVITLSTSSRGTLSSQSITATGVTGATSGSGAKLVGSVNGGAPSTGTFSQGDFVTDLGGGFWICTVSGSPGTWVGFGPRSGLTPLALGTATAGTSNSVSRVDHTHPTTGLAVLANANTFSGQNAQTAAAWAASGLTGATSASRYVGATASGAPTSGTFAVGDFIIDQTGSVYICTVAGSPGTWVTGSGGGGAVNSASVTTLRPSRPVSGEYLVTAMGTTSTSITGWILGQVFFAPLDIASSTTFSGIGSNINTAGAGGATPLVHMGLYADDGTGSKPTGAPLANTEITFDPTTTTGDRYVAWGSVQTLGPARVWVAWLLTSGSALSTLPTVVTLAPTQSVSLLTLGNSSTRGWITTTSTNATNLPTISSLSRQGGVWPIMGLRTN